jgi:hypothetical protein
MPDVKELQKVTQYFLILFKMIDFKGCLISTVGVENVESILCPPNCKPFWPSTWNTRHVVSTGTKSYMLHDCWPWSSWQFVKRRMHELIYAYAHTNNYLSFSIDTIDDASTLGLTKRHPPHCRTTIRVCPHESSVCEQPCQNSHEDWAIKLLSSVQTHDSLIYTSIILS